MNVANIDKIFDSISNRTLFKNKDVLQAGYTPETIPFRDKQIEQVASILAPALIGQKTSNLFVYGKTGSGKTLTVRFVEQELKKRTGDKSKLRIEYINCKFKKQADTEYRLLATLIEKLGGKIPPTGLPTDMVYQKFLNVLESLEQKVLIIILDEIDQIVKKIPGDILYNLTRINSELPKKLVAIVGISNDLRFLDDVDSRVKSSLGEEEIVFPPYDGIQLKDILNKRATEAFKEGSVDSGAIAKCAALAAREHGDARRALDLLRVAGEIAERGGDKKITTKHIDEANAQLDKDKIISIVETEPAQFKAVLYAIMNLEETKDRLKAQKNLIADGGSKIFTGDVYNVYEALCKKISLEVLTQRRVGDIIGEFDMLGIINAQVISKGRYGRTKEIKMLIPNSIRSKIKEIIQTSLSI